MEPICAAAHIGSYAEFRNMRSVSTQSRRKLFLRLQILRIFSHCGARRSACRARETPHVSELAVPRLPSLQASPWDQPADRLRSFEYHHVPTTAPPCGYPPWLVAPTWHWCAVRHEGRRVSFVMTHTLARPSSHAFGGYIRTPSVSSGGHGR